ncbi:MAG: immunoglobulin domain-containing protein [Verrucomicrobiia bacterium]
MLTNVRKADAGEYDVMVANNYGSVTSRVAVLTVEPPVFYVDGANRTPAFPFTSWETAATSIQDAMDAGTAAGRLVLVTNGIYASGGRAVEGSLLTNRVTILKPITVQSVNGPGVTIIEGTAAPGGSDGDGAVRCVYLEADAVLSGFTLRNGHTRGEAGGFHESEANGGGVWSGKLGTVSNCVLAGNSANVGGGAFHSTLINCVLAGNSAAAGGGAGLSTLYNCTLSGNVASDDGGGAAGCSGAEGALVNCIVYSNTAPNGPNYVDCAFQYSCATPLPPGPGNMDADPQFVNRAAGDLHPRYGSPCTDAGADLAALITTDLDGHPRPQDGNGDGIAAFDLGAYEISGTLAGGPIVVTVDGSSGPGDWVSGGLNTKFQYGDNNHTPPKVVSASDGLAFTPGNLLFMEHIGGLVCQGDSWPLNDANGRSDWLAPTNILNGVADNPSAYFNAEDYPAFAAELAGTFADSSGAIVETPFAVGNFRVATIPTGATRLQLGDIDSNYNDNWGAWQIRITEAPPALPIIVAQPLSQEVLAGTNLDLSVQAVGAAPLSYQWQHNGVALSDGGRISGITTNLLAITDLRKSDMGNYQVVVANNFGSVTSRVAVVTVVHAGDLSRSLTNGLMACYRFGGDIRDSGYAVDSCDF